MFLSSWSIALTISSLIVLGLLIVAGRTAVRVLLYWDPSCDDNRQIRLENETWLASTLVEYGLGFQIVSLVVFVLAADSYGQVITGAMCATGALLANEYGMPVLFLKMAGVFLYGFWIVLHHLDISAENYPLVRLKYWYLILLLPVVAADLVLQTLYIAGLKPDIITSCCAVVFGTATGDGQNLLSGLDQESLLFIYYPAMFVLAGLNGLLGWRWREWLGAITAIFWVFFFGLALLTITNVISSYVYAMPYHKCPFCLLKPEYDSVGFLLYITLIAGTFFGISPALVTPLKKKKELTSTISRFQLIAMRISLLMLILYGIFSSYHLIRYMLWGGEH